MKQILTRGNVVVNNLKVGDIIYEFEHGLGWVVRRKHLRLSVERF